MHTAFGRLRAALATACFALLFAIGLAAGVPGALAYAPDGEAVAPPPLNAMRATLSPMRPTRGEKSSLPSDLPSGKGEDDESPAEEPALIVDPHAADAEVADEEPGRATIADVAWDGAGLPDAVGATRARLIEAARTGDVEALRPLFEGQARPPLVSSIAAVADPVAFLQRQSGDAEGREILAILIEVLESGHVFIEEDGTYVWPYFAEVPLSELEPSHQVELYRLLTSLDVEEMERQGRYTFFRVGIARDGRLRYFAAGDLD